MATDLKLEQVIFPATQVPSSDPNTLDDYEEGTWTPVLGGDGGASGQTYLIQKGSYTKIGRQVTAIFAVKLSVRGTLTGTIAAITGLPFVAGAGLPIAAVCIGYATGFASNIQTIAGYLDAGTSVVILNGSATTGTSPLLELAPAVIAASTFIVGSVTYFV
jgi:hypothetical protein